MRGFRAALAVTLYVGIMLLIAFLYFQSSVENRLRYSAYSANQSLGIEIYALLAILQFALILLITPAQTAGAISGEREKQTFDLLLCTKMTPAAIILGKLFSSLSFILLLIIGSIPLFSLVFLFGGVGPLDVLMLFVFYLVTAFGVGSIGIFCSSLFKRTVVSIVVAYVTVFALGILTVSLGVYMLSLHYSRQMTSYVGTYIPFVLYINPAVGLADLLSRQVGTSIGGILGFFRPGGIFGGTGGTAPNIWIINSLVILVIAIALLLWSAWIIKPIKRTKGKSRS